MFGGSPLHARASATGLCKMVARARLINHLEAPVAYPFKDVEFVGNVLGNFSTELFLSGLETGAFPVAESTARSGRYPKMWDLPAWH